MVAVERRTKVLRGVSPDAIPFDDLLEAGEPVILEGLAADWPAVAAGRQSAVAAMDYLRRFDGGKPMTAFRAAPETGGRFFYDETASAPNFEAGTIPFGVFIDGVCDHLDEPNGPHLYIGSTDADQYFPGFRAENDLILNHPMFRVGAMLVSLWIGNRTTAAAHYDMSNNFSCCLVGERRFTLFPPSAVADLYPGPLEPTPGGQVVSMVDFRNPDFDTYPRFRQALAKAQVAELEPGDVLFFPALWWHQVEALSPFNAMMNYWWNNVPAYLDNPMDTLLHGLLSLRDRPEAEKEGWRALFDYYVFGPPDTAGAHLPEPARGALGELDDMTARRLRAKLLRSLNR